MHPFTKHHPDSVAALGETRLIASLRRWLGGVSPPAPFGIGDDCAVLGGNPRRLEVYGWASWSPAKGIVTLRNPSDRPATFTFEAGTAFELPAGAIGTFRVQSPYADAPAPMTAVRAGEPVTISLRPFEVLVFECTPEPKR